MSKLIVITGITGIQGSSVANTFLALPDWRIRGITRNPSSEAAQAFSKRGVEIVKADLEDKASLIPAFKGAAVIFSNTDYFQNFFGFIAKGDTPSGRTPEQQAYDAEIFQGINIAEVAASPEILETLERFVVSTLSDASKWSGGKWKTVWHYDCKAVVISTIHQKYPELASRMSLLQMGHYVTNWKAFPRMAPLKQVDGSFLLLRPTKAETKYEFVDAERDTGAFVKALLDVPAGKHLLGVGESLTMGEWIEIWGRVNGVKAGFRQVSRETFFEGVPAPLERELGDAWGFAEEFGHYGGDPEVLRPEEIGVSIPVTSMEEYIRGEDWSEVLNSAVV